MVNETNDRERQSPSSATYTGERPPPPPPTPTPTPPPTQQHQDQNGTVLRGKYCAVYDATAPRGCKIKSYKQPGKSDRDIEALAAKINDLKLNCEKDVVAKLNELMLVLKKKMVVYEMVDIGGYTHSPTFTMRVQSDDITAFGTGASKKAAKKQAAIAFMEKMDFNTGCNAISSTTSNNIIIPNKNFIDKELIDLKSQLNPIGLLQETCMNYHWQLPSYEFIVTDTVENSDVDGFVVDCLLYTYKTSGVSKTKQSAKRLAARLMYEKVKNFSADEITQLSQHIFPSPINIMLHNHTTMKNTNGSELYKTTNTLKTLEGFYNKLKESTNPAVNNLKSFDISNVPGNAIEILDQIGVEEGFTSTYVLLCDPSSSQVGVLVQVSVTPLIVHVGTGKTMVEAQEAAANVALIYLKLFLD